MGTVSTALPTTGRPESLVAVVGACQGCGACLLTCPTHAIRPGATRPLDVRDDLCTGCGECVEVCPVDAVDLVPRPSEESL